MELDELNRKITPEAINQVERYQRFLKFNTDKSYDRPDYWIVERRWADWRRNAGKPLANSIYLHELTEIEQFQQTGINPFEKGIYLLLEANPAAHYKAHRQEHEYLKLVLESMAAAASLGTIIALNPTYDSSSRLWDQDLFRKQGFETFSAAASEIEQTRSAFDNMIRKEKELLEDFVNYDKKIRYG